MTLVSFVATLLAISEEHIDADLLLQAFTHKSFSADTPDAQIPHSERLEFFGDSILGARVAEELFLAYPHLPESKLTLAKIYLVKEYTLAQTARSLGIGEYIRLGNGESRSGGANKDAVLSDTLEAFIAYIHLAHGRQSVASFIKKYIMTQLQDLEQLPGKSYKSMLQERAQKTYKEIPVYTEAFTTSASGAGVFTSEVVVAGSMLAHGTGGSKKKAQEAAAKVALARLSS